MQEVRPALHKSAETGSDADFGSVPASPAPAPISPSRKVSSASQKEAEFGTVREDAFSISPSSRPSSVDTGMLASRPTSPAVVLSPRQKLTANINREWMAFAEADLQRQERSDQAAAGRDGLVVPKPTKLGALTRPFNPDQLSRSFRG